MHRRRTDSAIATAGRRRTVPHRYLSGGHAGGPVAKPSRPPSTQSRSRHSDSSLARACRPTTMPGIHRTIAREDRLWRNVEGAALAAGLSSWKNAYPSPPNRVMPLSSPSATPDAPSASAAATTNCLPSEYCLRDIPLLLEKGCCCYEKQRPCGLRRDVSAGSRRYACGRSDA